MVGGDKKAFERCRPIFEVLRSVIKYFGPSGNGHLVKAINNVLVVVNSMAVSDAGHSEQMRSSLWGLGGSYCTGRTFIA